MSFYPVRKVGIILCTYNPESFLIKQIESINKQVGVVVDIFIHDDGSCIDSSKLIDSLSCKVKDITHWEPSKSAGKNFIRALHSMDVEEFDYIAFSDQDDIWLEDKVIHAIKTLEANNCHGYSSDLTLFDGESEIGSLIKSKRMTDFDHHFQGASAGCTYVLNKELVISIKKTLDRYDYMKHKQRISHDWLVYYIARVNGFDWFMDENSKILYRQHDNNVYGANRSLSKKIKMIFGDWYTDNVRFASNYNQPVDGDFNVNCSFYTKVSFLPNIFSLRREFFGSFVCYVFWLLKYRSN